VTGATMKPAEPARWFLLVRPADGAIVRCFFEGAPDFTQVRANARRYCQGAARRAAALCAQAGERVEIRGVAA